nr:uncharacterized protein K02A2.6-like [Drosophila bipectinata]
MSGDVMQESGENGKESASGVTEQGEMEIEEICLKDKIIDSWAPLELKKKLLGKEYSLDEVIEACQVEEQISKQSEAMLTKPITSDSINKITARKIRPNLECSRCGRMGHANSDFSCPARAAKCNKCSKIGHFARQCRTTQYAQPKHENRKRRRNDIRCVEDESADPKRKKECANCFKIYSDEEEELINCQIGGHNIALIIDSGSKFNLISQSDWARINKEPTAIFNIRSHSQKQFRGYASEQLLEVIYVFEAPISAVPNVEVIATFFVIKNGRQSLLGRETAIKLNVLRLGLDVNRVEMTTPFPKWKGVKIKLWIDPKVIPIQQPVRRIPVALEEKVAAKLEESLSRDIIESVTGPSSWISPIVLAFKENGDIRLCIDMRRANKAIRRENYPLPTFESFMPKLKDAKYFSRLDLKDAYHQLELDEASREITTFITPKGLFRYKRLMFGINSAPEIFQRHLEQLLAPFTNVMNYIDDVIIFGASEEEHDKTVKEVCNTFKESGVLLNDQKCIWKTNKLKFLGHIISDEGIEVDPDKINVIRMFREPLNKEETRSFLGLVTYVGKFIPDLADYTDPLRKLLRKDSKFSWGETERDAFRNLKDRLEKVPNLAYFDPLNRTRLIADASPVALGAVLLQFSVNADPLIISFASKALSDVERRYSQTEKESLALVWAVEKFYFYLAGLHFELVTDHKPLEAIFKPTSRPPARIERWLLRLQSFDFKVVYKAGKENISDALSRLCPLSASDSGEKEMDCSILQVIENSIPQSMTISEIAKHSVKNEEIIDAKACLECDSWKPGSLKLLYPFRFELSAIGPLLLRGNRIVIPQSLRNQVLELAHEGHPGESAMKRRLRSKVWWPLIDRDAENYVKRCRDCLLVSQCPRPAPMDRNPFPTGPWIWVASDILGPLPNNEFVIVFIDYYSRYMEFKFLRSISTKSLIEVMKEIFCRLGYPKYLKTDNGRQYISQEFEEYCKTCGIEQVKTPPYWPQANGEVENMNRSLVKRLKIAHSNSKNYREEIQKFVLMHNVTPHGTTGVAPTQLMFNRVIRDKVPCIGDIDEKVSDSAERDRDCMLKEKGKEEADKKRGAREADTEFEVVEKDRNIVKIRAGGRTLTRNVSHLKKIPINASHLDTSGPSSLSSPQPKMTSTQDHQDVEEGIGHRLRQSPEDLAPLAAPSLKLKLVNKGGMWEPAMSGDVMQESGENGKESASGVTEQGES